MKFPHLTGEFFATIPFERNLSLCFQFFRRWFITILCVGMLCGMTTAKGEEFVDFGENREITFPDGFRILDSKGNLVKEMPDTTKAVARGYENRGGKKWYVSDYSWAQQQKGKPGNYMLANEKPGPTPSSPDVPGLKDFDDFKENREVRFRDGYTVQNAAGEILKTVEGYQIVTARGYLWKGTIKRYVSDFSFEQMTTGKAPNFMVPLGDPKNVAESFDPTDLISLQPFADWESYCKAIIVELEGSKEKDWLKETYLPGSMAFAGWEWFDAISSGFVPADEATQLLRNLLKLESYLGDEQKMPEILFLLAGDRGRAAALPTGSALAAKLNAIRQNSKENSWSFLERSQDLFHDGLAYLWLGKTKEAAATFRCRKDLVLEIIKRSSAESTASDELYSFATNAGDNSIPNAFGCDIYMTSLLKEPVGDLDVDFWIKSHLGRTVGERLGLTFQDMGENNGNIEDFATFDYRNLLAVMHSPKQLARIFLSAKGTAQQFHLATGGEERKQDITADTNDPLAVLKHYGIEPWTDAHYQRISEGTLCLDYLRIRNPNPLLPHKSCYVCLAYSSKGVHKVWRVEDLDRSDERIRRLTGLAAGEVEPIGNIEADYTKECAWFLETFVSPGLSGEKPSRLVICPDGALNFVPFEMLLDKDGKLLLERFPILRTPNVRFLVTSTKQAKGTSEALLVGDPEFDDESPLQNMLAGSTRVAHRFGSRFGKLPGTADELQRLLKQMGLAGWKTRGLTAKQATEANLAAACRGPKVLHIASHAYYLPEWEKGRRPFGGVQMGGDYSSGVVLAGANTTLKAWTKGRQPEPGMDGILSAEEFAKLNLDGCELVVLSACESAKGKVRDGEGVQGLTLAGAVAGAQNQITTLWPVQDEATVAIMDDFYAGFLKGESPMEALRAAKLKHFAAWRGKASLSVAMEVVAPFVCHTTAPFSAIK